MRIQVAAVAIAAVLSGCATSEQIRGLTDQDFGAEPTARVWQQNVKLWFDENLKDPESARYRMACAVKGYVMMPLLSKPGFNFVGYLARVDVNAKNGFGGYGGFKPYIAMVNSDGTIRNIWEATEGSHPLMKAHDLKPCRAELKPVVFSGMPS